LTASDQPARVWTSRRTVLENAGLLLAATLLTLRAEWRILFSPNTFQPDAEIHTFWMRRFQDPALFNDPLTRALIKAGYVPLGLQGVYRLASYVIDPVVFGPWLGVVLAPLSAWLVFLIVREHTDWWPAAWMGAALFLLPVDYIKFSGGHARAFDQPVVLLTVYLLLRRRFRMAAAVPAIGSLFYPPAAVSALAVTAASCLMLRNGRPRLDRARTLPAIAGAGATAVGLLLPRLLGREQALITAAQARRLPEFGPHGQMVFFTPGIVSTLKATYSGFNIEAGYAVVLLMTVVLLAIRPRNVLLLRHEVLWMAVSAFVLYGMAFAVLFRLYLPDRYTYPLFPFCCVAIAVWWQPTFESLGRRLRWLLVPAGLAVTAVAAYLALRVVPLGPQVSARYLRRMLNGTTDTVAVAVVVTVVVCLLLLRSSHGGMRAMVAVAAVLAGTLLLTEVAIAGGGVSPAVHCNYDPALLHYLGSLPPSAIIAGDPLSMDCVTMVSERPVVISRKLYQVFSTDYLRVARPRMFAMIDAYFGTSRAKIDALKSRYGADYLVVIPSMLRGPKLPLDWYHMAPFGGDVAKMMHSDTVPAAGALPARCRTYHDSKVEVYSLSCVAQS
jgi:hypothetical protein